MIMETVSEQGLLMALGFRVFPGAPLQSHQLLNKGAFKLFTSEGSEWYVVRQRQRDREGQWESLAFIFMTGFDWISVPK